MRVMRASDRARDGAIRILRDARADGRLSTRTFEQRVERALGAQSVTDLHGLTLDIKRVSGVRAWLAHVLHAERAPAGLGEACLRLSGVGHRPVRVGRSRAADFVVHDATVSRLHAQIERTSDGFILIDLSSTNGAWIDGRRVGAVEVRPGDLVWLGEMPLHVL
jgi:hypothetical protein